MNIIADTQVASFGDEQEHWSGVSPTEAADDNLDLVGSVGVLL